jgi:hypothetical protein
MYQLAAGPQAATVRPDPAGIPTALGTSQRHLQATTDRSAQCRPRDRRAQSLRAALLRIAPGEDEERFLAALRIVEPSNAETLAAALERERSLRQSYDRIEQASDLFRPIVAAKDVAADKGGPRRQIAHTVFDSFAPQLDLSFAAAFYGLAGLFLGSLIGELLIAVLLPRHRLAG